MHDLLQKFLIRAHAAWRWRWYGLASFWIICLAAWIVIAFIPNRYSSSAQVEIDTDSMLRPLMVGIAAEVDTESLTRVEIVKRSLFSRANIEKVMRMADLDIFAQSPREYEQLIASVQLRLSIIRARKEKNLFTISFVDTDPEVAREVVRSFLTIFEEANLSGNRADIERTKIFIAGQLRGVERELVAAETRLSQFRVINRDFLPGEGSLQDQLDAVLSELESLRSRKAEEARVRDQLKIEIARVTDMESPQGASSPQALRVSELEKELKLLLTKFKDNHPDVIALRRLLETEKAELEITQLSTPEERGAILLPLSSQLQQLRLQLSEYDTRIGSMSRRITLLEGRSARMQEELKRLPEIQSEYAQLERNYDIIKENHNALLERREAARFAGEIEAKSNAVEFRVIAPPNLPLKPDAPNRQLLRAGGTAMGVGIGLTFPVLLSLAFPTFGSAYELQSITRRPVIGKITIAPRTGGRLRRGASGTAFAVLLLGLIFLSILIISGLPDAVIQYLMDLKERLALWEFRF